MTMDNKQERCSPDSTPQVTPGEWFLREKFFQLSLSNSRTGFLKLVPSSRFHCFGLCSERVFGSLVLFGLAYSGPARQTRKFSFWGPFTLDAYHCPCGFRAFINMWTAWNAWRRMTAPVTITFHVTGKLQM